MHKIVSAVLLMSAVLLAQCSHRPPTGVSDRLFIVTKDSGGVRINNLTLIPMVVEIDRNQIGLELREPDGDILTPLVARVSDVIYTTVILESKGRAALELRKDKVSGPHNLALITVNKEVYSIRLSDISKAYSLTGDITFRYRALDSAGAEGNASFPISIKF